MVKKRRVTKVKIEINPEDINKTRYAIMASCWRAYYTKWGIPESLYKTMKRKYLIDKKNKLTQLGICLAKRHNERFLAMHVEAKEVSDEVKAVRSANVKKAQAARKAKKENITNDTN